MRKSQVTTLNLSSALGNTRASYRLMHFLILYMASISSIIILSAVEPISLIFAYPVIATITSRFISRRIKWWNQTNSVENIFRAKLRFWLFWPYEVPSFIIKVAIARYL